MASVAVFQLALCCLTFIMHNVVGRMLLDRRDSFPKIDVNISWSVSEDTQTVYFEIIAPVTESSGWLALGLTDNGGMKGADIALVSLHHQKVFDLHSNDFTLPIMDKVQDWKLNLLSTDAQNGYTIAQISRTLLTCDSEDNRITMNPLHQLIMVAYSEFDSLLSKTTDTDLSINIHQYKDVKDVNLFLNEDLYFESTSSIIEDNSTYDEKIEYIMRNASFDVSDTAPSTQYRCSDFYIETGVNVTGEEILDGTQVGAVHHVDLFKCSDEIELQLNEAYDCSVSEDSSWLMDCFMVLSMHPSTELSIPSTVYYPVDPGNYVLLIHYELGDLISNPSVNSLYDSESGLVFFGQNVQNTDRTPLGPLMFQADYQRNYFIPPGQKNYEISYALHSSCSDEFFPDDGIDLVVIGGHMHLTGSKIRIDRIRTSDQQEENQVTTIYEINAWDFDRQFGQSVSFHLNRNDSVQVHCFYDTSDRTTNTYFYDSTYDEMCLVFMLYVPRMDGLVTVMSTPTHSGTLDQSYCGNSFVRSWEEVESLGLQEYVFENTQQLGVDSIENGYKTKIMDDTSKYCSALVFDELDLSNNDIIWHMNQNFMSGFVAIFMILIITISLASIERILLWLSQFEEYFLPLQRLEGNVELTRKMSIYIFSMLFQTIMLILLILSTPIATSSDLLDLRKNDCDIVFNDEMVHEHVYTTYVLLVSNWIIMYAVAELLYRQVVTWDLYLHHFLTILIILTLQGAGQYTLNVKTCLSMGFWYLFQISTEQPLFFALMIRKLRLKWPIEEKYHSTLFYFASVWHYVTKITTTGLVIYIFADALDNCNMFYIYNISYEEWFQKKDDPVWDEVIKHLLFVLIPLLFSLQMYQGTVFWRIGNKKYFNIAPAPVQQTTSTGGNQPTQTAIMAEIQK